MHIVITISFWIVLYKRSVQFINQIQFEKRKSFEMGEKFTILFYFQIEIHPERKRMWNKGMEEERENSIFKTFFAWKAIPFCLSQNDWIWKVGKPNE